MATYSTTATSPEIEKPRLGGLAGLEDAKGIDVTKLKVEYAINEEDPDEEFGGTEERSHMEKRLLRKLDLRYAFSRACERFQVIDCTL